MDTTARTEIRRILCPVDFSGFARRALHHAVAIAKWYGSTVEVMHVASIGLPPAAFAPGLAPSVVEVAVLTPEDRKRLLEDLARFAEHERHPSVATEHLLAEGDPAREILRRTEEVPIDLVVLGTHGRSGFDRLVLGSVAEKVVRKARCPVLTVPQEREPEAAAAVPALFHHILAAVDFSEASEQALRFALSLAEEADAHLTLLHVIEVSPHTERWLREHVELGGPAMLELMASAKARLEAAVPASARVYCHVEERVESGDAYGEILRVAAETHVGLIVLGAHSRGVLERMFFGSTAHHVVRRAACPVLTLRGPD
jgi:nucleotide-binding universal stress UspA family protein